MKTVLVIPTRYASTRLPGKPLHLLAGKPLVQHVHERAMASGFTTVLIATDDERIRQVCVFRCAGGDDRSHSRNRQ